MEIGTSLGRKIGEHGTSSFRDKVLKGQLTMKDLEDIPPQETKELLFSIITPTLPHYNKNQLSSPNKINT